MVPHFKSIATSRFICNFFSFSSCAQIHKGTQEMEKQQKLDAPAPNSCIYNARVHIGKLKWGKMNFLDHGKIAKLLLHGVLALYMSSQT